MSKIKGFAEFLANQQTESMVAGDSAGDPIKISTGETSGSVVNNTSKKKVKRRTKDEL